ncbi:MAG: hypothetical protein V7K25_30370 [Nostoc sp.]
MLQELWNKGETGQVRWTIARRRQHLCVHLIDYLLQRRLLTTNPNE